MPCLHSLIAWVHCWRVVLGVAVTGQMSMYRKHLVALCWRSSWRVRSVNPRWRTGSKSLMLHIWDGQLVVQELSWATVCVFVCLFSGSWECWPVPMNARGSGGDAFYLFKDEQAGSVTVLIYCSVAQTCLLVFLLVGCLAGHKISPCASQPSVL